MLPAELAVIKARVEAATPGPWVIRVNPDNQCLVIATDEPEPYYICDLAEGTPGDANDGVFIAHSCTDILTLIAEIERLQELQPKTRQLDKDAWQAAVADSPDLSAIQTNFNRAKSLLDKVQEPFLKLSEGRFFIR